ncbi:MULTISPECIES: hypothetical protein [unclassified Rhodanobacter]|uniref:hypothetical protein n=1 Tax=unclassified Rhodanobacter TaxID=2621553 RepID=UPI0034E41425
MTSTLKTRTHDSSHLLLGGLAEDVRAHRYGLPLAAVRDCCVVVTPGTDSLFGCSEERRHLHISGQAKGRFDLPFRDIHDDSKSLLTVHRQPLFTPFSQCLLT